MQPEVCKFASAESRNHINALTLCSLALCDEYIASCNISSILIGTSIILDPQMQLLVDCTDLYTNNVI